MRSTSIRYIMMSLPLIWVLHGCAANRSFTMPEAGVQGMGGSFFPGQIISLPEGRAVSFERLINELNAKRLVFVGEVHDDPGHHLVQVQILQALMNRDPTLDVAMECFQVQQQPIINGYLNGKIDENRFLKEVRWQETWGFPYRFYRPLIQAAKYQRRSLIGINAPADVIREVAKRGLKGINPEERDRLARDIDLTNTQHRAFLREVYKEHAHHDLKNFEYFYEAQCAWEDTMAENIAKYLKTHSRKLIVFVGNGHIMNRYGIPDRVLKRLSVSMAIVAPYSLFGHVDFRKDAADYIWLTGMDPYFPVTAPGKVRMSLREK